RQFGERAPERAADNRATVFALAAQGILTPHIARAYPLTEFRTAMEAAARGDSAGRIVLLMDS
ncbi:zinc-binding dehydrogenase, partial [Acinetobacter baumannii]